MDISEINWQKIVINAIVMGGLTLIFSKFGCKGPIPPIVAQIGGDTAGEVFDKSNQERRETLKEIEALQMLIHQQQQEERERQLAESQRLERERVEAAEYQQTQLEESQRLERERAEAAEYQQRQLEESQRRERQRVEAAERKRQLAESQRLDELERAKGAAVTEETMFRPKRNDREITPSSPENYREKRTTRPHLTTSSSLLSVWTDSPDFPFRVYVDGQYLDDCTSYFSKSMLGI